MTTTCRSDVVRLWKRTRRVGQCRVWTGACNGGTKAVHYPYARVGGRVVGVHRVMYEHYVGPIPPGHDVHHVCPQTRCVNPNHLQAVPGRAHEGTRHRWTARGHA